MSLLTSASIWSNDDSSGADNKKRIPTMRKTLKKMSPPPFGNLGGPDEYISSEKEYKDSQHGDSVATVIGSDGEESRTARVNQLINQMAPDNDGNKLANFVPLSNPAIQVKKEFPMLPTGTGAGASATIPSGGLTGVANYSTDSTLGNTNTTYSNYKASYDPAKLAAASPYYQKMGLGPATSPLDNKLMEKINYMIHMMEEQQSEKTNNVTEEIILYTFLGVFIIFVVDSFARAGKYIR